MTLDSMIRGGTIGATLLAVGILLGVPAAGMAQTAPAPAESGPTPRQPSTAQSAQQARMRDCNAEAGKRSLAGDARRPFMSECLAGRMPPAPEAQPSAAQAAQRDRMTRCNAEAGTRSLAAEARRGFMRDCLAGNAPPPSPAATGGPRG